MFQNYSKDDVALKTLSCSICSFTNFENSIIGHVNLYLVTGFLITKHLMYLITGQKMIFVLLLYLQLFSRHSLSINQTPRYLKKLNYFDDTFHSLFEIIGFFLPNTKMLVMLGLLIQVISKHF